MKWQDVKQTVELIVLLNLMYTVWMDVRYRLCIARMRWLHWRKHRKICRKADRNWMICCNGWKENRFGHCLPQVSKKQQYYVMLYESFEVVTSSCVYCAVCI